MSFARHTQCLHHLCVPPVPSTVSLSLHLGAVLLGKVTGAAKAPILALRGVLGEQERGAVRQPPKGVGFLLRCELPLCLEEPHDKEAAGAADRAAGVVSRASGGRFERDGKERGEHLLA